MTPEEILTRLAAGLDENAAKGLTATVQLNLSGENGGAWVLTVKDGRANVTRGSASSPSVTMAMTTSDYVDMATGKLDRQVAFLKGKLKISGDMTLAMKLQTLFKPMV